MSQQQLSTFSETEKKAMERYKWWPVYLVREKRRLAGITAAVRAGAADAQIEHTPPTPEVLPAEEFLMRAEQEGEAAFPDPLSLLDDIQSESQEAAGDNPVAGLEEPGTGESLVGAFAPPVEPHDQAPEPAEDVLLDPEDVVKKAFHNQPDDDDEEADKGF